MPPQTLRFVGRHAVAEFFATVPADGRLDLIRLVQTRANGHPTASPTSAPANPAYGLEMSTPTGSARSTAAITAVPRRSPSQSSPRKQKRSAFSSSAQARSEDGPRCI